MARTNKAIKAKNKLKPDKKTTGERGDLRKEPNLQGSMNEQDEGQHEPLSRCHSRRQAPWQRRHATWDPIGMTLRVVLTLQLLCITIIKNNDGPENVSSWPILALQLDRCSVFAVRWLKCGYFASIYDCHSILQLHDHHLQAGFPEADPMGNLAMKLQLAVIYSHLTTALL